MYENIAGAAATRIKYYNMFDVRFGKQDECVKIQRIIFTRREKTHVPPKIVDFARTEHKVYLSSAWYNNYTCTLINYEIL